MGTSNSQHPTSNIQLGNGNGARYRWTRIPVVDGLVVVNRDGSVWVWSDEISTREAAQMLGCSVRHVQAMCDYGVFRECTDWRRNPVPPGGRRGGVYRIKRESVLRHLVAPAGVR
jgi:hypothetical protein